MIRPKNIVTNIHAIALLLLFFYLLFIFLASGHRVNLKDFKQLKLLLEMVIFLLAAFALFFSGKKIFFGNIPLIVLLILVQLSLIDFYVEISEVEYGDKKPVVFFILFFLLFVNNLLLIYSRIKQLNKAAP